MNNQLSNSHQEIHGNSATSGISLYVRVAASIRSRILEGEWNPGDQLPKIDAIAQSYGVAQITASKAIQTLVAEGLLSSARGRGTHVLKNPEARTQHPDLRAAINDPRVLAPDHSIDIIWKKTVSKLPAELEQNYQTAKKYIHVHKLHNFRGTPFALMDIYLEKEIYERFPKNADQNAKLSFLLREYGKVDIEASRQELTVTHATQYSANLLKCSIAAPLVRIRRWREDNKGVLIYSCLILYRSDLFVWDMQESHPNADHFGDHLVPKPYKAIPAKTVATKNKR
jgi:DNA-binding GntR family transcriptional regulator